MLELEREADLRSLSLSLSFRDKSATILHFLSFPRLKLYRSSTLTTAISSLCFLKIFIFRFLRHDLLFSFFFFFLCIVVITGVMKMLMFDAGNYFLPNWLHVKSHEKMQRWKIFFFFNSNPLQLMYVRTSFVHNFFFVSRATIKTPCGRNPISSFFLSFFRR